MSKINVTCPKCHLIPFVNIKESKVPELEIKCPCSYEESLPLKDYLNVTEKRNKLSYVFGIKKEEIVKEKGKCILHKENDYKYYCFTCQKNFCYSCFPEHVDCKIVDLSDLEDEDEIDRIVIRTSKFQNEVIKYCTELKDEALFFLGKQMEEIEEAYNKKIQKTMDICTIITILINNYIGESNNYFTLSNVISNSNFNLTKCNFNKEESNQSISKVFDYFRTSKLLDKKVDKMKEFVESKIKKDEDKEEKNDSDDSNLESPYEPIDKREEEKRRIKLSSNPLKYQMLNGMIFLLFENKKILCYDYGELEPVEINGKAIEGDIIDFLKNGWLVTKKDDQIIVYENDLEDYFEKIKINGILKEIYLVKLIVSKDMLLFASKNNDINFVSLKEDLDDLNEENQTVKKPIVTTINYVNEIMSLIEVDNMLIYYTFDGILTFFSLDTNKVLSTLSNIKCYYPNSLYEKEGQVIIGGINTLTFIDVDTMKISQVIQEEFFNGIHSLLLCGNEQILLCTNNESIIQYDFEKKVLLKKLEKVHEADINIIYQTDDGHYVTLGLDSTIKKWKF